MRKLQLPRWMYPGMHLKRWLLLSFLGITVMALGSAILIVDWYRRLPPDSVIFFVTGAGLEEERRVAREIDAARPADRIAERRAAQTADAAPFGFREQRRVIEPGCAVGHHFHRVVDREQDAPQSWT